KATFNATTANAYEAEIQRAEERVLVDRLTWLATAAQNPQVRAIASLRLSKIASAFPRAGADEADGAHARLLADDIKRFLERPAPAATMMPAAQQPPGAPIGDVGMDFLGLAPECGWRSR